MENLEEAFYNRFKDSGFDPLLFTGAFINFSTTPFSVVFNFTLGYIAFTNRRLKADIHKLIGLASINDGIFSLGILIHFSVIASGKNFISLIDCFYFHIPNLFFFGTVNMFMFNVAVDRLLHVLTQFCAPLAPFLCHLTFKRKLVVYIILCSANGIWMILLSRNYAITQPNKQVTCDITDVYAGASEPVFYSFIILQVLTLTCYIFVFIVARCASDRRNNEFTKTDRKLIKSLTIIIGLMISCWTTNSIIRLFLAPVKYTPHSWYITRCILGIPIGVAVGSNIFVYYACSFDYAKRLLTTENKEDTRNHKKTKKNGENALHFFLNIANYSCVVPRASPNGFAVFGFHVIIDQHFSTDDRKIIHALWDSHEMPPLLGLRFSNYNLSHELPDVLCQSISGGTIAVIGPIEYPWWQMTGVSSPAFSVAESYSRTLGLPIIRLPSISGDVWENPLVQIRRLRPSSIDESIELAPSPLVIGSLLHSFVESREFTDAVILFEDDLQLIQLQDFLRDSHIPGRLTTLLRRLPSEGDYGPVLKHVLTLFSSNTNTPPTPSPPSRHTLKNPLPASLAIVIHANIQTSREVLIQASSLGLCQPTTQFVVTNLDTLAFLDLSSNSKLKPCNVTAFSVIDPSSSQISDLRLKLKAHGIPLQNSRISTRLALWSDAFLLLKQAFNQAAQSNFHQGAFDDRNDREQCLGPYALLTNFRNFIVNESNNSTDALNSGIGPLTGHIKLTSNGLRQNVTLFVISKNGKRKMEKVSLWRSESNSLEPINKSKVESTISEDLDGKKLRVTVYLEEPFVMLRRETNKLNLTGNARYEGYCIDLLDKIAKMRNFTYEIHEVHDKTYGVREGQRWNGMVGELMSKEADLAVASLTVTYSRSEVIDFTVPYMHLGISILFKRPLEAQPGLFTFTLPMSNDVWLAMLGAYIFASAAIWLMAQLSPYEKFIFLDHSRSIKRNLPQIHRFTFLNSAWFTLSSLMQQGSDLSPRSASTRMAAAVWWFFALIFMSSYTANLAAFLTTERMFTPIENADDLARQTKIKYGTLNRGSTMTFFKDSKVETYEKMWKLMESQPGLFVKSSKEGIERVKTSDYAYLMESSMLEYAIERDCELIQIGGLLDQKGYAFGLPKGSPFRKPISTTILRLQEKTVLTELKEKWWKRERGGGVCSDKKLTQSEFGARSVGGIFLILAVGIVISIAIAVVELVMETRKKAAIADTKVSHEIVKEIKRNCSLKRKRARSQPTNREEMDRRLTAVIEELIES
ncbi:ligand-gated ion channel domain-containing protein [Ditylenchus destructor]|nr:ligand-gated ion channel domain-containing protein [Ditylenchus destructor]